jgi:hypothetical protein
MAVVTSCAALTNQLDYRVHVWPWVYTAFMLALFASLVAFCWLVRASSPDESTRAAQRLFEWS